MQLDRGNDELARLFYRGTGWVDEKTDANARVAKCIDAVLDALRIGQNVQAAFGGDLFPALRHKGYLLGFNLAGDLEHLGDARHLQIEIGAHGFPEALDVVVLDVPAVFAQMRRNAVSTRGFAGDCCLDRIRLTAATRLP